MIIDSHTHLMLKYGFREGIDIHEHMRLLHNGGVDKAVVFTLEGLISDYKYYNDKIYRAYKTYPDEVIPFCSINPRDEGAIKELYRCKYDLNMKGIKFHPWLQAFPIVDDMIMPIVEEAVKLDMPIISHDGTPPYCTSLQVAYLASCFPKAKVILGHAGLKDFAREAICAAKKYDNVYLGFCGAMLQSMKVAVREVGPEKCMFGSDSPFAGSEFLAYEIQKVKELGLSKEDEENILGGNIARLLNITFDKGEKI